jgi:hypothetical protein
MTDPFTTAARKVATDAFEELRRVVDGIPAEALDWQPAGPETNSIAVLVTHAMNSTRLWLKFAAGLPLPTRDRDAEFGAKSSDPAALLRLIDDMAADCGAALDSAGTVDWSISRPWKRASGEVVEVSPAYAVLHGVEHLRGHVDQASLTRHLWEARA